MKKKVIDLKVGETMQAGNARITLEHKSGRLARLVVHADEDTQVSSPKEIQRMSAVHTDTENSTHGKHAIR